VSRTIAKAAKRNANTLCCKTGDEKMSFISVTYKDKIIVIDEKVYEKQIVPAVFDALRGSRKRFELIRWAEGLSPKKRCEKCKYNSAPLQIGGEQVHCTYDSKDTKAGISGDWRKVCVFDEQVFKYAIEHDMIPKI